MEDVEITLNYQGEDYTVIVDLNTANELLNDPLKADEFVESSKKITETAVNIQPILPDEPEPGPSNILEGTHSSTKPNSSSQNKSSHKIWSQKRPTPEDLEATEAFLKLRLKYSQKFDDRRTMKSQLWQKIASELAEMGVYVGEGREAVEKLRLKFSNLQKQYFSYIKQVNTTGESQRDPPPFYDMMHDILGKKDKTNPSNLQDTLQNMSVSNDTQSLSSDCDLSEEERNGGDIKNRFKRSQYETASKTLKPASSNLQLLNLAKSEASDRKQHMAKLEDLLETQNKQRDKLLEKLDKIIDVMSRKRKRNSSDSE